MLSSDRLHLIEGMAVLYIKYDHLLRGVWENICKLVAKEAY